MRVLLLSSMLLVTLTGCKTFWNPTFLPSGYAHHRGDFKSPPGPEARNIGYEYSAEANQENVTQWREAASDLVQRAKSEGAIPSGTLYLTTDMAPGAFRNSFDFALREQLNHNGYTLAATAEEGAPLMYSAGKPHKAEDGTVSSVVLSLATLDAKGKVAAQSAAMYDVPFYGRSNGIASASASSLNAPSMTGAANEMRDAYNQ